MKPFLVGRSRCVNIFLNCHRSSEELTMMKPGHLVTLVLAADLGIFDDLAEGPKTLCELATPRNADVELVKQILRTLRSMGFVSSEGQRYIATALTHHIAKASVIAGVRHL